MDIKLIEIVATSCVALTIPSLTYFFTKKHERDIAKHNLKLGQYQEFMNALASIVEGEATEDGHRKFAKATNTLQLVASNDVIIAMHAYRDQIRISNPNRSMKKDDELLSSLVWALRKDLDDPPTPIAEDFSARLWASGPPKNRE